MIFGSGAARPRRDIFANTVSRFALLTAVGSGSLVVTAQTSWAACSGAPFVVCSGINTTSGAGLGIRASNSGIDVTNITATGTVSGGAISPASAGEINGTVELNGTNNSFNNFGIWNLTWGTNRIDIAITDLPGGVITSAVSGAAVTVVLDGVGSFESFGRIAMINGMAGDTLQINGNARFNSGSVYALDVSGANSDRIVVNGSAQLAGALVVNLNTSTITIGPRYTILTATGGISGRWDFTPFRMNFLTFTDTYDANNSYLEVSQYRTFASAGQTSNQIATGAALDTIPKTGALYGALAFLPNDEAARNAFNQLSGEVHASSRSALIEDSGFVRDGALGRLRNAFDAPGAAPVPVMSYASGGPTHVPGAPVEKFSIWGQAYGGWGHLNGNGDAARLNRSMGGLTIGVDTPVFGTLDLPVRVGVMAGYSNASFGAGARGSSGSSDNYHLGAYAGSQFGGLGVRTGVIQSWHDIRATRVVNFLGFNDMLRANYDGRTTQVFGDVGYKIKFGSFAVEPFANLAYVNLTTSGFREVGGLAALAAASSRSSQTFSTLGARAALNFDLGGIATTLRGSLGWRHAFNAVVPGSTLAFAGSAPFNVTGIAIARDAAVVEAGLDVNFVPGATLGISYGGQFARAAQDHTIRGNLSVRF